MAIAIGLLIMILGGMIALASIALNLDSPLLPFFGSCLQRKRKMLKELQIKEVEKLQFNRVSPWISTPKKAEVWNLLFEWNPKVEIPQGVEWLSVVTHGAKEHVCGSYIGERAPYALKRDIENNLKKELAYYIFSFVIIWMVINTFLILYVNLCR
jgi:hypothetical protein